MNQVDEVGHGLEDLRVLQEAELLADRIWERAYQWSELARDTLGRQIIRAADSIGANIAEAFGRFHYGEKLNFLYYARGSLFETKYWVNRAGKRALLTEDEQQAEAQALTGLAIQINMFARALKGQRSGRRPPQAGEADALHEPGEPYLIAAPDDSIFTDEHLTWLRAIPTSGTAEG